MTASTQSEGAWPHRWNVLALTVVAQAMIVGIQAFTFAFWLVPWLDEFKVPRSELLIAITLSSLVGGALSPFGGAALDRYSIRVLYCSGAVVFAVGLLLISRAQSHWTIVLVYASLIPIGSVLTGAMAGQILIARWFFSNRGMALGLSALGVSLGAFLAPPVVTSLLAHFGWRTAFQWLAAGTVALIVPFAWIVLRRTSDSLVRTAPDPLARESNRKTPGRTTASLMRTTDFWVIATCFTALLIPYLSVLFNLGSFARDVHLSQPNAAFAASMGAVSLAVGKAVYGRLADWVRVPILYWAALAIMTGGVVTASFAVALPQLAIGLSLITFAGGSYLPLIGKSVVDRFGSADFGRVMGLVSLFAQAGSIAPWLASAIRDHTGSYVNAFLAMLIVMPIAALAMLRFARPNSRS